MLVLTFQQEGQGVSIGPEIQVKIVTLPHMKGGKLRGKLRLGITARKELEIKRIEPERFRE